MNTRKRIESLSWMLPETTASYLTIGNTRFILKVMGMSTQGGNHLAVIEMLKNREYQLSSTNPIVISVQALVVEWEDLEEQIPYNGEDYPVLNELVDKYNIEYNNTSWTKEGPSCQFYSNGWSVLGEVLSIHAVVSSTLPTASQLNFIIFPTDLRIYSENPSVVEFDLKIFDGEGYETAANLLKKIDNMEDYNNIKKLFNQIYKEL